MNRLALIPGITVHQTGPDSAMITAPEFKLRVQKRFDQVEGKPAPIWAFVATMQSTPTRPAHFTLRKMIHEALNAG